MENVGAGMAAHNNLLLVVTLFIFVQVIVVTAVLFVWDVGCPIFVWLLVLLRECHI